jgi:hypothetical protein
LVLSGCYRKAFLSDAGQRDAVLQVRAEDLKPSERRAALDLGQAIGAGTWSRHRGLRRGIRVIKRESMTNSVAELRPNSNADDMVTFVGDGIESISPFLLDES